MTGKRHEISQHCLLSHVKGAMDVQLGVVLDLLILEKVERPHLGNEEEGSVTEQALNTEVFDRGVLLQVHGNPDHSLLEVLNVEGNLAGTGPEHEGSFVGFLYLLLDLAAAAPAH